MILKLSQRSTHEERVPLINRFEVLSHHTAIRESRMNVFAINLYHKVDSTVVSHRANGSVLSLDLFATGIFLGRNIYLEHDVFTNGQTESVVRVSEREPKDIGVPRNLNLSAKLQLNITISIFVQFL